LVKFLGREEDPAVFDTDLKHLILGVEYRVT